MTAVFEHVAGELGIDPTKIAVINDGCEGKDMAWINENVKKPQGFDPARDSLKEVLERGKKAIDWDQKWHLPGTKKLPNGNYHGIGCMWVEAWTHYWNSSEKIGLVMLRDGTVNIVARGCENGTHRPSTYTQIVASEIGMRYEDVNWKNQDDPGFDVAPPGNSSGLLRNSPPLSQCFPEVETDISGLRCQLPGMGLLGPLFPGLKKRRNWTFITVKSSKKPTRLIESRLPAWPLTSRLNYLPGIPVRQYRKEIYHGPASLLRRK